MFSTIRLPSETALSMENPKGPRMWQWVKYSGYVQNVSIFNCFNSVVNSSVTQLSFLFMYLWYANNIVICVSSDQGKQANIVCKSLQYIVQMSNFLIFIFLYFISATSRSEKLCYLIDLHLIFCSLSPSGRKGTQG